MQSSSKINHCFPLWWKVVNTTVSNVKQVCPVKLLIFTCKTKGYILNKFLHAKLKYFFPSFTTMQEPWGNPKWAKGMTPVTGSEERSRLTISAPSRFSAEKKKKKKFRKFYSYFSFCAREKNLESFFFFFLANWLNFFTEPWEKKNQDRYEIFRPNALTSTFFDEVRYVLWRWKG